MKSLYVEKFIYANNNYTYMTGAQLRYNKYFKKKRGVSPVIATILLVAVTLVLVATLYIGILNMQGKNTQPIFGSIAAIDNIDPDTYKLIFSDFKPATNIVSLKIKLIINDTQIYDVIFNDCSSGTEANIIPSNITVTITYYDVANNCKINHGDYIIVDHVKQKVKYTITLLDGSGNMICSRSFIP